MSRTIDAQQQEFTTRSHLAPLLLVVLTTYSDRAAETVDTVFYFSDRVVVYDYGNAGTDRHFWPLLESLSPLRTSIDHVPNAQASGLLSKPLTITLSNEEHQGARLIETLRDGHTLENATVEVAQILQARQSTPPVDLTALDGDEHTVLYHGVVQRVGPISESEIVLQCTLDLPSVEYLIASDASITDPKDVGVRLPVVYGAAKNIPCVNYDVGFATTLSAQIEDDATTLSVTDTTGFQTSFEAMLGAEKISGTVGSATTLTSVTRGAGGTVAVQHRAGEPVVETISSAKFVPAGHPISAIRDLYAISPYNGEKVRVTTGYTKILEDLTLISGERVATAEFSSADLKALIGEMAIQSAVTRDESGDPLTPLAFVQEAIAASGGAAQDSDASEDPDAVRDHILGTENSTTTGDWPWREANLNNPITVTFADPFPAETVWEQRVHVYMRESFSATFDDIPVAAGPNRFGTEVALFSAASLPGSNSNPALFTSSFFTNKTNQFTIWSPDERIDVFEFWREIKTDGSIRSAVTTDQTPTSGSTTSSDSESLARDGNVATKVRLDKNEWLQMNFPSIATYHEQKVRVLLGRSSEGDPNIVIHAGTISGPVVAELNIRSWGRTEAQDGEWIEFVTDEQTDSFTITTPGGNRIHVFEMERTAWEHIVSGVAASNIDIEGANVGANLQMFADVDGYRAPGPFDSGTGITIGLIITGDEATSITEPDTATNWDKDAEVVSVLEDTEVHSGDGTSIVVLGVDSSADAFAEVMCEGPSSVGIGPYDLSGKFLRFDIRWDEDNVVSGDDRLFLDLLSSTPNASPGVFNQTDLHRWNRILPATGGPDTWWTYEVEVDNPIATLGSPDMTDVKQIYVAMHVTTPGRRMYVDNFRFSDTALAPSAYSVTGGDLMEHPADIMRHWIEHIGGRIHDSTSFASAIINLGTDKWAFDARTLGLSWPQIAARMQHGARSNLIPEETATGTVWKLPQAEDDYEWPAASGSITEWDSFVEAGRGLPELATRSHFPYAYNAALGIDEAAWTALVVATPDQSDVSVTTGQLATAEATFGRFDAEPVALATILEEATAEEIAGYYVHEGIRLAALFVISGVPWWEAYAVEVGDLLNVTPPWADASVKVRVIEYVKNFDTEQIELRCVEVV